MDAIRYEQITGLPVGGKFHATKGQEMYNSLMRWFRKNPNASESDIEIFNNLIKDINNSYGN